jgi:hypothetical protein
MDPYVEAPEFWRGAHTYIIASISAELNASLPPGFAANADERLYVVQEDRSIYPDVAVLRRRETPISASGAASAVADPAQIVELSDVEMREPFIEIVSLGAGGRVVTVIELLSHANKAQGGAGRKLYLDKQEGLMASDVSLLEIDLLRSGAHTAAVPRSAIRTETPWHYLICLHRAGVGNRFEVWPASLRSPLPRVRVPLGGDHPDQVLELQRAFDRAYDEGPYRRSIDYSRPPHPPLLPEDEAWADPLLRSQELRP